jgi:hypothetical protein
MSDDLIAELRSLQEEETNGVKKVVSTMGYGRRHEFFKWLFTKYEGELILAEEAIRGYMSEDQVKEQIDKWLAEEDEEEDEAQP